MYRTDVYSLGESGLKTLEDESTALSLNFGNQLPLTQRYISKTDTDHKEIYKIPRFLFIHFKIFFDYKIVCSLRRPTCFTVT